MKFPWWFEETLLFVLLTVVFLVFYSVAYSVFLGIRENYYRYAQKESLQWTGRHSRPRQFKIMSVVWLVAAALFSAWVVVKWVIFSR